MSRKNKQQIFKKVLVVDIASKGNAIAKTEEGQVILLSGVVPGDIVDVQSYKKRKGYLLANVIGFHRYSDKRVSPKCKHFKECGGCKWQSMDYTHQIRYKQNEIYNNLCRIAKISPPEANDTLEADDIYYYRNKMEFSFSDNRWISKEEMKTNEVIDNKNGLGFHISGMWDKVLDIEECHLQANPSNSIRNGLKKFALNKGFSFFNVKKQQGFMRSLMIRNTSIGELMVLVQFGENNINQIELVLDYLADNFPEITSLLYVVNQKKNDTIYDQRILCHKGKEYITEKINQLNFKIHAKSFYQTNSAQTEKLYHLIKKFANIDKEDIVYDLYTGIGSIALFLSNSCKRVVGIELISEAIRNAKENARDNNISNASFFAGDVKELFTKEFIQENGKPDVIITDPPRDGMHKEVVTQLLEIKPKTIIYVSCNSATQARDLEILKEFYQLIEWQAVDMFPHTYHIENIIKLELK